jgi:hypothetical protein
VSEELRDLERAVAAGGGAPERLKLARALERLGRGDEARDVLIPARADVDVRRELGRFPWSCHATQGVFDVEPIRTKPVVKWSKPIRFSPNDVLAHPLATVAVHYHVHGSHSCALDAETGELLWDAGHGALAIVKDVVFLRTRHGVAGCDLWTGEALHETELPGGSLVWFAGPRLLAARSHDGRTLAFLIGDDPRLPPSPGEFQEGSNYAGGRAARDVVYAPVIAARSAHPATFAEPGTPVLVALGPGQRERWRLITAEDPSSPIYDVAPLPRRLYCAAGRNTVFCLEAPP